MQLQLVSSTESSFIAPPGNKGGWGEEEKFPSTYTVSLLPAQGEIEAADLGPLHKVIMSFVKERLGMREQKSSIFPEKVSSSSVFVACMAFTILVKVFNGAQGVELINLLTQYQSFIGGMQALLLDKYDADGSVSRTLKQVRGKSNDPAGQSAFACLNQCSKEAEKKKKEMRTRCFKEALPRVDGIHATLSQVRKTLLLLFVRIHHNTQLPLDFDCQSQHKHTQHKHACKHACKAILPLPLPPALLADRVLSFCFCLPLSPIPSLARPVER